VEAEDEFDPELEAATLNIVQGEDIEDLVLDVPLDLPSADGDLEEF